MTFAEVISYRADAVLTGLPILPTRLPKEGKVTGKAAQAFDYNNAGGEASYAAYMMGHLVLPKRGIKDVESVGSCSQTFTVVSCQPLSLEVALTFQERPFTRFMLSSGDVFRIPPDNGYRLENHSRLTDASLTWSIIRPYEQDEAMTTDGEEDDEDDDEESRR